MKKFIYNAPVPCHFTHNSKDYSFYPGESYELADNIDFVKTLVAQGKMKEVTAPVSGTQKPPKN